MNTPTLQSEAVGGVTGTEDELTTSSSASEGGIGLSPHSQWPQRVLLVCSSGGHLAQLVRLRQWWETRERMWVTFPGPDSESQLIGEDVHIAYHPTTRNATNAMRNLGLALRLVHSFRPDVVVSSGAGVAVPFFIAARLRGIRTVYLEVFDRIDGPTLTGRLCYPITDLFLLQWAEQKRSYPRGHVVGSVF